MVTFSVPLGGDHFFSFAVESGRVLFAGSRHGRLPASVTEGLVDRFGRLGFSFLTGCAPGIDQAFRDTLFRSDYADSTIVACAFRERAERLKGCFTLFVVPDRLPARAALAKRTLWMTNRCSLLVLFPSDPIGKGSSLAFKSAIMNNKPVFVVSKTRPAESHLYSVYPSSLYGLVDGWWCVPPVYADTGLCYEVM